MKTWRKIGEIGVDSGLCMVGDPCYYLHRGEAKFRGEVLDPPHPEFEKSWEKFVTKLYAPDGSFNNHQIGKNLAVIVPTGVGDGVYNVYGRFGRGGCEAVKVVFIQQGWLVMLTESGRWRARGPLAPRYAGDPIYIGYGRTRDSAILEAQRDWRNGPRVVCWAPRLA